MAVFCPFLSISRVKRKVYFNFHFSPAFSACPYFKSIIRGISRGLMPEAKSRLRDTITGMANGS